MYIASAAAASGVILCSFALHDPHLSHWLNRSRPCVSIPNMNRFHGFEMVRCAQLFHPPPSICPAAASFSTRYFSPTNAGCVVRVHSEMGCLRQPRWVPVGRRDARSLWSDHHLCPATERIDGATELWKKTERIFREWSVSEGATNIKQLHQSKRTPFH